MENNEFYNLFILLFSNKKGPHTGGWWLVTKTSEYGILGVGEGGVLTYSLTTIANVDIKTIKHTTRTSTAITPQQQQQQYMRILGVGEGGC